MSDLESLINKAKIDEIVKNLDRLSVPGTQSLDWERILVFADKLQYGEVNLAVLDTPDTLPEKENIEEFVLTDDQMNAWVKLQEWAGNDKPYFVLRGYSGSGKCVEGSTLINTTKGMRKIEEVCTVKGTNIYTSFDKLQNMYGWMETPTHTHKRKEFTIKILDKYGYTIEGTKIHPLYTVNPKGCIEWTLLKNITKEHCILHSNKIGIWPKHKTPINFVNKIVDSRGHVHRPFVGPLRTGKELATVLGLLVSEGSVSGSKLQISNKDNNIIALFKESLLKLDNNLQFNEVTIRDVTHINVCKPFNTLRYMECCGLRIKQHCKYTEIPKVILRSPRDIQIEFIKAYFEGDGGWEKGVISCCSSSKKLIKQMQVLLLNFEIITRTKSRFNKKLNRYYWYLIISGFNVDTYMKNIGFLSTRKNNLYKKVKRNTNVYTMPISIINRIKKWQEKQPLYKNGTYINRIGEIVRQLNFNTLLQNNNSGKSIDLWKKWFAANKLTLLGMDQEMQLICNDLDFILHNNCFISQVEKIIHSKKEKWVYDFSMPQTSSFIGNGFINHNSTLTKKLFTLGKKIYPSAPTNKAAKVLEKLTGQKAKTTHSQLGLRMESDDEKMVLKYADNPPYFSRGSILIVDEASMIAHDLLTFIKDTQARSGVKVLFVGDPAQLPPIGEINSQAWKVTSDKTCRATLKKIVRYDDQLLTLATRIRDQMQAKDYSFPIVDDNDGKRGVFLYEDYKSFRTIIKGFTEPASFVDFKVIGWRNKTVERYNDIIRESFGFTKPFEISDLIWLAEPVELDGKIIASIDDEYTVKNVINTEIKTSDGVYIHVHQLQLYSEESQITIAVPKSPDQLDELLARKAAKAKRLKKYERQAAWRDFWETKKLFCSVRYAYAGTAHRIQGTTLQATAVDVQDILANKNKREAWRALYVACTRPTTTLYVY